MHWHAGLALYIGRETIKGDVTGTIMPGCAAAIASLCADWTFVAVTARWGVLPLRARSNTEAWLAAHGMSMPVYYAPMPYRDDGDRAVFKQRVIADIIESKRYSIPSLPFLKNGANNLDLRCVLRAASNEGCGNHVSNPEKKAQPHYIYICVCIYALFVRYGTVVCGVGDRPSDMVAYTGK